MHNKVIINLSIFFAVIFSIFLSSLLWRWVNIPYNNEYEIIGEYSKVGYNPLNESIRYLIFISFPLIVYLLSIKIFRFKETKQIKEIFLYDLSNETNQTKSNLLFFYFLFFLFLVSISFFSSDLPMHNLDLYHEGELLTPAINYLEKKGFWTSSYITHGFYYEILSPIIGHQIFDKLSIGSARFCALLGTLAFKFFLIVLIYQLTLIQKFRIEMKVLFFLSLGLFALIIANKHLGYRELPLILFLNLLIPIISFEKENLIYFLSIGFMSAISVLWGVDRGAFLNATLLFLLFFLLLRKNFRGASLIFIGVFISWVFTYLFFGSSEFNSFLYNTLTIYQTFDWIGGLIHPEPFSLIKDSARATRALLTIILCGILLINLNLFEYKNISAKSKIVYIFIFIIAVISYRSALGRSDSYHMIPAEGFPRFLLLSIVLTLLVGFFSKYQEKFKIFYNLSNLKSTIYLIPFIMFLFFAFVFDLNAKNFLNFKSELIRYVNIEDESFLSDRQTLLIKQLNKTLKNEKCVQIFTYDAAIPYLLKKPSCNKFFSIWSIGNKKNQQLFIKSIDEINLKFILLDGELKNFGGQSPSYILPLIHNYIQKNYNIYQKIDKWSLYKRNSI